MISIAPSKISGNINSIPSKSFAHRALILASLCSKQTLVVGESTGIDTVATMDVLSALGATFTPTEQGHLCTPITTDVHNDEVFLNVRESGSTLRFILPLVATLGRTATIVGEGRLASRPNKELIDALRLGGACIDNDTLPLKMSGKLDVSQIKIRADISSQFVSGLLMAMQLLPHETDITLLGELKSTGYVDMTISCMLAFGAIVKKTATGYHLSGGGYTSPDTFTVEGDWSNSAFWLVNGAISGNMTVTNLLANSLQGDKAIIDILKTAGAYVTCDKDCVTVSKSQLNSFTYDMENIPDLVPITAVLASFAKGETILTSVERLRLKESDRIQSTIDLLDSFNVTTFYDQAGLHIIGGEPHSTKTVNGANDHRIVMSACILAANSNGASITDEDAVNKSYKNFYKDFVDLGGQIIA